MKTSETKGGTQITACPGCRFNPIRSHPKEEALDVETNWTRTCPRCRRKLCITCFPVGKESCVLEDCISAGEALGIDAVLETPLFGGRIAGDEPLPSAPEPFRLDEVRDAD